MSRYHVEETHLTATNDGRTGYVGEDAGLFDFLACTRAAAASPSTANTTAIRRVIAVPTAALYMYVAVPV